MITSLEKRIIPLNKIKIKAIKQEPDPSPLYPSSILTVLVNIPTIMGTKKGYIIVSRVLPKKGITGEEISINPMKFAMKKGTPEIRVKNILFLDFNLIWSSINPIRAAIRMVKRKIIVSFIYSGKKKIIKNEDVNIPIRVLRPPDSGISG